MGRRAEGRSKSDPRNREPSKRTQELSAAGGLVPWTNLYIFRLLWIPNLSRIRGLPQAAAAASRGTCHGEHPLHGQRLKDRPRPNHSRTDCAGGTDTLSESRDGAGESFSSDTHDAAGRGVFPIIYA